MFDYIISINITIISYLLYINEWAFTGIVLLFISTSYLITTVIYHIFGNQRKNRNNKLNWIRFTFNSNDGSSSNIYDFSGGSSDGSFDFNIL